MHRSALVLSAAALFFTSACVVVPLPGTSPVPGGPVAQAGEDWGQSLRGRALQRPGEFINFFSDGTFAWDGPNGQQSGIWSGGVNRLCLIVRFQGGGESEYCGIAYLTNGQLEFLSDAGGAPIYWNIR